MSKFTRKSAKILRKYVFSDHSEAFSRLGPLIFAPERLGGEKFVEYSAEYSENIEGWQKIWEGEYGTSARRISCLSQATEQPNVGTCENCQTFATLLQKLLLTTFATLLQKLLHASETAPPPGWVEQYETDCCVLCIIRICIYFAFYFVLLLNSVVEIIHRKSGCIIVFIVLFCIIPYTVFCIVEPWFPAHKSGVALGISQTGGSTVRLIYRYGTFGN